RGVPARAADAARPVRRRADPAEARPPAPRGGAQRAGRAAPQGRTPGRPREADRAAPPPAMNTTLARRLSGYARTAVREALVLPVLVYRRLLSPLKPPCCRFRPTCSEYAVEALRTHGAIRGLWLTARRILR